MLTCAIECSWPQLSSMHIGNWSLVANCFFGVNILSSGKVPGQAVIAPREMHFRLFNDALHMRHIDELQWLGRGHNTPKPVPCGIGGSQSFDDMLGLHTRRCGKAPPDQMRCCPRIASRGIVGPIFIWLANRREFCVPSRYHTFLIVSGEPGQPRLEVLSDATNSSTTIPPSIQTKEGRAFPFHFPFMSYAPSIRSSFRTMSTSVV